jgi:UDP-N-acetylglucosamine/UDP-N-acetylgalactosamine diphosphorylase
MIKVKDSAMQKVIDNICSSGQGHIFLWWDKLSQQERNEFISQISEIDLTLLRELVNKSSEEKSLKEFKPAEVIPTPGTSEQIGRYNKMRLLGEEKLRQGKIACFVVAGGQSTRLGYDLPKGTFKVGPITEKSLFQFHAEKILAINMKYNTKVPWYIMTSKYNSSATKSFFEENGFFGLPREDVFFMEQGMLPSVDFDGKLILDSRNHVAVNPDGHGGVIRAIRESKALEDMKRRGIEHISYFQVDNVLVKVGDPVFLGYHAAGSADMSCKVVRKHDPEEKIGIIVEIDGKSRVVEYSELSKEDMYARNRDGSLKYSAGSIAVHIFSVDFLARLAGGKDILPYHVAKKKIKYLNQDGKLVVPDKPNGIKFETFIFDALKESGKSVVLETKREDDFSPLKNKTGADSPETVKRDLLNLYRSWLEAAGINNEGLIEVSPLYAWNKDDFIKKVKERGQPPFLHGEKLNFE